jgi:dienelactone hydrolase
MRFVRATCGYALAAAMLVLAAMDASAQPKPQTDLTFPFEARELPNVVPLEMALYKPSGSGPFPALVIYPSGGGLRSEIADWTIAAVRHGYVVLMIDYMRQRSLTPQSVINGQVRYTQGAIDALQALAHLRTLKTVDPDRIGVLGFSWGGMAALLAGSAGFRKANVPAASRGFTVAVSFYPGCYYPPNKSGGERLLLRPDHDTPTLILQGATDEEGTPAECMTRVAALQADSRPIELHAYPGIGHAWDAKSVDGFRKVDSYGKTIVYRFSQEVTDDSSRRSFDFLDVRLKK